MPNLFRLKTMIEADDVLSVTAVWKLFKSAKVSEIGHISIVPKQIIRKLLFPHVSLRNHMWLISHYFPECADNSKNNHRKASTKM